MEWALINTYFVQSAEDNKFPVWRFIIIAENEDLKLR
jgi:hypothetical protein